MPNWQEQPGRIRKIPVMAEINDTMINNVMQPWQEKAYDDQINDGQNKISCQKNVFSPEFQ